MQAFSVSTISFYGALLMKFYSIFVYTVFNAFKVLLDSVLMY